MSDAKRDQNRVAALLAKSNASNELIELLADSVTSRLLVNATISGSVQVAGLVPESFDYIALTQTTLEDIWTYKTGGSSGTLVATVTVTFTSSAKSTISNVART
jgi:hypothetical protein